MTPEDKVKLKNEAEIRSMDILVARAKKAIDDEEKPEEEKPNAASEEESTDAEASEETADETSEEPEADEDEEDEERYIVEGYAARYEPYVLFVDADGNEWTETFTRENFEGADRSDIILQFDHFGRVYARTGNGTLKVDIDDKGLHVVADLSRTEGARQLYEDIAAGMVTKMSWRFSTNMDDYIIDEENHNISYKSITKIYDVSAVSIPANDNTEIASNARSVVNGLIDQRNARIEAERKIENLKAEIREILGGNSNVNE